MWLNLEGFKEYDPTLINIYIYIFFIIFFPGELSCSHLITHYLRVLTKHTQQC